MGIDRTRYLDADEAERLRTVAHARAVLDAAAGRKRGPLLWALVDTALVTGLRVSELARLVVGDLDARRGMLRVWRHKRRKRLQESMAISPTLAAHLSEFVAWKASAGQPVDPDSPLFWGKRGPLGAQGLAQAWRTAIRLAGLPRGLSIHCARHTAAVQLLGACNNLRAVQKHLGHASPTTTANMYADVPFKKMQEAVAGMYAPAGAEKKSAAAQDLS